MQIRRNLSLSDRYSFNLNFYAIGTGPHQDGVQISRLFWFAPSYSVRLYCISALYSFTINQFLTADSNTRSSAYSVLSLAPIPFPALGTLHHAIWGYRGTTAGCAVTSSTLSRRGLGVDEIHDYTLPTFTADWVN